MRLFNFSRNAWMSILIIRKLVHLFNACQRIANGPTSTLISLIWKTGLPLKRQRVRQLKKLGRRKRDVNLVAIVSEESVEAAVVAQKVELRLLAVSRRLVQSHLGVVHDPRNLGVRKSRNVNLRFHLSVRKWLSWTRLTVPHRLVMVLRWHLPIKWLRFTHRQNTRRFPLSHTPYRRLLLVNSINIEINSGSFYLKVLFWLSLGTLGGNPPPPAFAGYAAAGGVPGQTVGYEKELQSFIQRTALNEEYEKKVELFLQRVGKG